MNALKKEFLGQPAYVWVAGVAAFGVAVIFFLRSKGSSTKAKTGGATGNGTPGITANNPYPYPIGGNDNGYPNPIVNNTPLYSGPVTPYAFGLPQGYTPPNQSPLMTPGPTRKNALGRNPHPLPTQAPPLQNDNPWHPQPPQSPIIPLF